MNLEKKKILASKTLKVGKNRIIFNNERLAEIKEAITKQDIKDLYSSKAISIKEIVGRKKKAKRKTRRRLGSIKQKVNAGKRGYINLTRKLRKYIKELLAQGKIKKEQYVVLRKQIKASAFRSKNHLKEQLSIQNG
jgi:large subunit ribosomal protein L19e